MLGFRVVFRSPRLLGLQFGYLHWVGRLRLGKHASGIWDAHSLKQPIDDLFRVHLRGLPDGAFRDLHNGLRLGDFLRPRHH